VSGGVVVLAVVGLVQVVAVLAAIAWANRRIRANNPISRTRQLVIFVPLVVNLALFWYLCFTV
jgi:hypothetical protein